MIFLLDSSALVAHALQLPGAVEVQALLDDDSHEILLSALSLYELAGCLKLHDRAHVIREYWEVYRQCLSDILPVEVDLVQDAWLLREQVGQRIPIVDCIIAASALRHGAILVHRDQHLASIPGTMISQMILPSL